MVITSKSAKAVSVLVAVLGAVLGSGCTTYTLETDRPASFSWRLTRHFQRPRNTFINSRSYTTSPDQPGKFSISGSSLFPVPLEVAVWTETHVAFKQIDPIKNELEGSTIVIEPEDWRPATAADLDIARGIIRTGMTKEEVERLFGPLHSVQSSTFRGSGRSETWTYGSFPDSHLWIYFRNGRVSGWAN